MICEIYPIQHCVKALSCLKIIPFWRSYFPNISNVISNPRLEMISHSVGYSGRIEQPIILTLDSQEM
ncbi:hypothetical protein HDE70_001440 [Pedobacter cryoconitis]|nr:hypothetical protein [Pedobacter cryoconitis]